MRRRVLWLAGTPACVVPLVVALVVGLRVAEQRTLPELPPSAATDYASRFGTGFPSLREGYVRQVLGQGLASVAAPPDSDGLTAAIDPASAATSDEGLAADAPGDPLRDLPVGSSQPITPQASNDGPTSIGLWRSQGASISADGGKVAFASTDTRIQGMDSTPCQAHPPGPTVISAYWWGTRGTPLPYPPPDPGPCEQVVVEDLRTGETRIASVGQSGELANSPVHHHMISGDGRFVVFATAASNLVPGDTNDVTDIFVRDLVAGRTQLASVSTHGGPIRRPPQNYPEQLGYPADLQTPDVLGSVAAEGPAISHDGRYVLFESSADDLVQDDTAQSVDVFVRDRLTGTTERVTVSSSGEPPPREDVQADNRWRLNTVTTQSAYPCMSPNARYVVFRSLVSNLVPGDNNDGVDLFLRDRATGRVELVSVSSAGAQQDRDVVAAFGDNPYPRAAKHCVSNDGRYVLFSSNATNLVEDDTNGQWDIFLRDRANATTRRVSVNADGSEARSPFTGWPPLPGGTADHWVAYGASLSPDGNFIAFASWAELTPDDPGPKPQRPRIGYPIPENGDETSDLYVYDIGRGRLTRLDVRAVSPDYFRTEDGEVVVPEDGVDAPALSWGGSFVAYHTRYLNPHPLKGSVRVYRWRDS